MSHHSINSEDLESFLTISLSNIHNSCLNQHANCEDYSHCWAVFKEVNRPEATGTNPAHLQDSPWLFFISILFCFVFSLISTCWCEHHNTQGARAALSIKAWLRYDRVNNTVSEKTSSSGWTGRLSGFLCICELNTSKILDLLDNQLHPAW